VSALNAGATSDGGPKGEAKGRVTALRRPPYSYSLPTYFCVSISASTTARNPSGNGCSRIAAAFVPRRSGILASLRPCQCIHALAFGRFDEILYLVEKDFRPHPSGLQREAL